MAFETTQLAELNEEMAEGTKRGCFCFPYFGWRRMRGAEDDEEEKWWDKGISALKKVQEWSEIAAGPRWKTFIRRFNRSKSGGGGRHEKYQYDPLSYSLNFDEGPGQNGDLDGDEFGYPNFSARYAAIPMSAKTSMDLGKEAAWFHVTAAEEFRVRRRRRRRRGQFACLVACVPRECAVDVDFFVF